MTNREVIDAYLKGQLTSPDRTRRGNLHVEGNELKSYKTTIATITSNRLYINTEKYSTTTSHHQSILRNLARAYFDPRDILFVYPWLSRPVPHDEIAIANRIKCIPDLRYHLTPKISIIRNPINKRYTVCYENFALLYDLGLSKAIYLAISLDYIINRNKENEL